MQTFQPSEILVAEAIDGVAAQQSVRRMARTLGFAREATDEIALVVAELASSIVKHAGRGAITFRPLQNGERAGIEVEAQDQGPGIADVQASIRDGYSTSGTLGCGLSTVNRLMDELEVSSAPGSGVHVVCRRWVGPANKTPTATLWDVGVVTRSKHSAPDNGDAFVIKQWNSELLVAVIDGLGHGEQAQKAALVAQQYVQDHYDQPLDQVFAGTSRACRATRGVVMALASFPSRTQLTLASLGNVEARAHCGRELISFHVQRGIVGTQSAPVSVQQFAWSPRAVLVLHTDGVRTQWQWDDFPGFEKEPAQMLASKFMRRLADDNDDATVLVVKNEMP